MRHPTTYEASFGIYVVYNRNLLSDVRMYADDTNLTFASKDPNELFSSLTHDFGNLKQWLDSNRLSLNVLKTKCLFTGTRQKISLLPSDPHISLNGRSNERVNSYKCLGIQVDETLSWEAHISEVIGEVAKALAALRRLTPICPQSALVTIYKSLIISHLDYCCMGNGLSQKLEKLQTRAACIITGSSWDASSAPILHALKWDSLAVIEFLINNSYVLYANYFYLSIFLLCRLLRNFYC